MDKLTLNADPEVIALAKKLAKERGTSVSAMFSDLIKAMASDCRPQQLAPLTRKSRGIARLPAGKSYRELLGDALWQKYGR